MTSVNLILLLIMNFFFRAFPLSPHRCAFQLSSHRYMNHKRPKNSWYPFPSRIFSSLPSDNHHFSLRLTIETAEDMEEIGAMLSVLARPPDVLFLDGGMFAAVKNFTRQATNPLISLFFCVQIWGQEKRRLQEALYFTNWEVTVAGKKYESHLLHIYYRIHTNIQLKVQ